MAEKSVSTSFQLLQAPESWSKYITVKLTVLWYDNFDENQTHGMAAIPKIISIPNASAVRYSDESIICALRFQVYLVFGRYPDIHCVLVDSVK